VKRTEGGGQAERRTPSGRAALTSLNLIHRNKVPNPASMRVPACLLAPIRKALYLPVRAIPYLPGGPLRWLWVIRVVCTLDAPLRHASIDWRALDAKSE